jgi:hypothetical protein
MAPVCSNQLGSVAYRDTTGGSGHDKSVVSVGGLVVECAHGEAMSEWASRTRNRLQCQPRFAVRLVLGMPEIVQSSETVGAYWVGCACSTGWLIQATLGSRGGCGRRVNRCGCVA